MREVPTADWTLISTHPCGWIGERRPDQWERPRTAVDSEVRPNRKP
jgi:hypothetical protein